MRYKPKFCCECGVPIERNDWKFFSSRRFCELCETDFKFEDWLPRVAVAAAVLFGIFGLGTFLQKAEKPLKLTSANTSNQNKSAINSSASVNTNTQFNAKTEETNHAVAQSSPKPVNASPSLDLKARKVENQTRETQEAVYFCGAETKKGTPCSRRVKGGGRCWQHDGKPAMLPPEKLIASR